MSTFIKNTLDAIKEFLNGINNTIWGLLIIFVCMRMISKGINIEAAYYFAGVGSTMIGIKASQMHTGTITDSATTATTTEVK